MKPRNYSERTLEVEGWPLHLVSYQLGGVFRAEADNVSPGANLARATGATKEEAEEKALATARRRLARTRRQTA